MATTSKTVRIIVEGKDSISAVIADGTNRMAAAFSKASKAAGQTTKSIKTHTKQTNELKNSLGSLNKGLKAVKGGMLGLTAGGMVALLSKTLVLGERVQNLESTFTSLTKSVGINGTRLINKAAAAMDGLATKADLMQRFNQGMLLGLNFTEETFAKLAGGATKLARAMGIQASFAMESLTLGIGRQSRLWLDNLGIIVRTEAAYKTFAESISKTVAQLTQDEKQLGFEQAAIKGLENRLVSLGEATVPLTFQFERLRNTVMDHVNAISQAVASNKTMQGVLFGLNLMLRNALKPTFEATTENVDEIRDRIGLLTTGLNQEVGILPIVWRAWKGAFGGDVADGRIDEMNELDDMLIDVALGTTEAANKMIQMKVAWAQAIDEAERILDKNNRFFSRDDQPDPAFAQGPLTNKEMRDKKLIQDPKPLQDTPDILPSTIEPLAEKFTQLGTEVNLVGLAISDFGQVYNETLENAAPGISTVIEEWERFEESMKFSKENMLNFLNEQLPTAMESVNDALLSTIDTVQQGMADTMKGMIKGTSDFGDIWKAVWNGILDIAIDALIQIATRWLINMFITKGAQAGIASAGLATNLAVGSTGAFASQAMIPIVGPELAAIAMAAALTSMTATATSAMAIGHGLGAGVTAGGGQFGGLIKGRGLLNVGEFGNQEVILPLEGAAADKAAEALGIDEQSGGLVIDLRGSTFIGADEDQVREIVVKALDAAVDFGELTKDVLTSRRA